MKNPLAVTPIASTPDPLLFLVVPLPMEIDPLRDAPPGPPFSMLIIDFERPTVPKPLLPVVDDAAVKTERAVAKSRETGSRCFVLCLDALHALGGAALPTREPVLALGPMGITSMASSISSSSSMMLSLLRCGWEWNEGEGERRGGEGSFDLSLSAYCRASERSTTSSKIS